MKNIANNRKPFRTQWKITEGSLSESGPDYEPELEDEGSRNKEISRADPRHPNKISDTRSTHRNESGLRQQSDVNTFF